MRRTKKQIAKRIKNDKPGKNPVGGIEKPACSHPVA
jgi:hypothetical protein